MAGHLYDRFRKDVQIVLQSKLEEFRLFDYNQVTEDDLWNFLTAKVWTKPKENVHIYEIVADIMQLKVSDFFTFQTVEQLKGPDWFTDENSDKWKELLKK